MLVHAIGNTPLVRLPNSNGHRLYAKLEYLNPGGSVKDRSALYLITQAERRGQLKPGSIIIDASSGNQGIATAMIGAMKGYRVIICVSDKISTEKLNTLRAYGADVRIFPATEYLDDPRSYHAQAVALHKCTPGSYMPDQYFNPENACAHYHLLGPEIWQQTNGTITHFFAAAGTGGTVSGVGRYLKEHNPAITVIAVDAATSYRATHGHPQPYAIEGMGIDFNSPVLDTRYIDEIMLAHDADALPLLARLAQQHGLLVGPSSAAVAWAAHTYAAAHFTAHDVGVLIFGDSGRAYLSKQFYATAVADDASFATDWQPSVTHPD
jgi:cystathionine beta-synthase